MYFNPGMTLILNFIYLYGKDYQSLTTLRNKVVLNKNY